MSPVVEGAARENPLSGIFARAADKGNVHKTEFQRYTGCLSHLHTVPQETIACDICGAAQAKFSCQLAGGFVQLFHPSDGFENILRVCFLLLQGGGCHAEPQWLCQNERVARLQAALAQHFARVHETDDNESIFWLFILDRMPACDHNPCLARFFGTAPNDLA